jgi:hypothetical protein
MGTVTAWVNHMEIRRNSKKVSPQYEDAGLFQNTVCNVEVDLIPVMRKNNRGDLIVTGLVKGDLEIAVSFAGRRVLEAAPIIASLNALLDGQKHIADVKKSRLPLKIEGAWRPQFVANESGFETRTFHLLAAKWTVLTDPESAVEYGQPPAHIQPIVV